MHCPNLSCNCSSHGATACGESKLEEKMKTEKIKLPEQILWSVLLLPKTSPRADKGC